MSPYDISHTRYDILLCNIFFFTLHPFYLHPSTFYLATSSLIFEALQGRGDSAAAGDEFRGRITVHVHDGSAAEESAEFHVLAGLLAYGGNETDRGGLAVDHTDGGFIGKNGGDNLGGSIAGNGDHVETDGADSSHGFQLACPRLRRPE